MAPSSPPAGPSGELPYDRLLAFETILAASPLNVTIYDRDFIVREASVAAAELAGVSRAALVGRCLRDDLPADRLATMERVLAGESVETEGATAPQLGSKQRWTRVLMVPIHDPAGYVQAGMTIVVDVSRQKRADELIEKLAFVDPVTELPNRAMFSMMLSRYLSGAGAEQRQPALVWLNLDRFKDVNDALGLEAGDGLLRAVGERLRRHLRTNDTVAHIGADDFALLLPRVTSRQHLDWLMWRIHEVFITPFTVGDDQVLLSASCGIAGHPHGSGEARRLQENAHSAMRAAKKLGGGAFEIYEAGDAEEGSARLWLARAIRDGIEQGHFALHYQPLLNLDTMRVEAVEALARWHHPQRGLVSPADFIPFAEETGLIVLLGHHLRALACRHLKGWQRSLAAAPRLSLNISAREVQRSDVCSEVRRAAAEADVAPSSLEVEFTETAVLANPARAAEVAAGLRQAGATVALDDFGTGYSSLTYLRELPIDRLKIDRSFVGSCLVDHSASAILVALTHLAHDLGMKVVAEGIETPAQLRFVKEVGCDAAQGYHLARPLTHEDCTEYLRAAQG
jgi:diguanylate cyclase (GGDEF)-like protein/PAS domain S-box-containing protein